MKSRGEQPTLPPAPHRHLIQWWLEIGPTVIAGMGEAAVGWSDIAAWQEVTAIRLEPWEGRAIRRMSREFLSQQHEAKKPLCPSPLADLEEQAHKRDRVAGQFKALMGAMQGR